MQDVKLGCVLLAAGESARFGGNKLLAEFDGTPLYERAMKCLPLGRFYRAVAVTGLAEVEAAAKRRGMDVVQNDRPELGLSRSVGLGLDTLRDCDAVMFVVCDQPRLTKASVERLIELYLAQPSRIAALGSGERRGNPAIFPREYYHELFALGGDAGGSVIIKRHEDRLLLCQTPEIELLDADTAAQLEKLKTEP